MFDAKWQSSGVGFNGVGILGTGGSDVTINWGDGLIETLSPNKDTDDDGFDDAVDAFHSYGSDGHYIIRVQASPTDPFNPVVTMDAYCYTSEADNLIMNGTGRQDMILTGSGNDTISTKGGDDWVDAGGGNDTIKGGAGHDFLLGADGDDIITGGDDGSLLSGGYGLDKLTGGAGSDSMYGDAGVDKVRGEGGNDYLDGGEDNDNVNGGDGDDWVGGGDGNDTLIGGAGSDIFVFREETSDALMAAGPSVVDVISDYQQGVDVISFYDFLGPDAFTFIGTAKFSGTGPEIRYNLKATSTVITGDVNGDKVADFQINLTNGQHVLTEGDFWL